MKKVLPLVLFGLGVVLLALATSWVRIQPPTSLWTDEDHATLEKLNKEMVRLYMEMPPEQAKEVEARLGNYDGELTPYEKAVAARNKFREKRTIAMTRPKTIASALRWGGLGCLAVGVVTFYVMKELS